MTRKPRKSKRTEIIPSPENSPVPERSYEPEAYAPVPQYILPDEPLDKFQEVIRRIGIAEALALLGLTYVSCVGAFNAGYFAKIRGRFVELFSFSDLLGANIAVVQYIFLVVSTWCVFLLLFRFFQLVLGQWPWLERQRERLEDLIVSSHLDAYLNWLMFIIVLLLAILAQALSSFFKHNYLAVDLLPNAFFQGSLIFIAWRGFKSGLVAVRSFALTAAIGILYFSFESGKAWFDYDIGNPEGTQSILTKSDVCIDRKILRVSSTGYLLYSPTIRSFEFRNKDDIKTIFDRRACI